MQHIHSALSTVKKTFDEAALAATQPGTNLDKYSDHTGEQAKERSNRALTEMEERERERQRGHIDHQGYENLDSEEYKNAQNRNQAYVAEHEMRKELPGPVHPETGHRVVNTQPRAAAGPGIQHV